MGECQIGDIKPNHVLREADRNQVKFKFEVIRSYGMPQTKQLLTDKVSAILMSLLLLLRYPLLIVAQFGLIHNTISIVVFLTGTYLCTGILICRNINTLEQYCISIPALVLFLLSPVMAIISNPNDITAIARIVMAIVFATYIIRNRKALNTVKNNPKSVLWNCLFVLASVGVATVLFAYIRGFSGTESTVTIAMLANGIMFQLSFAAAMEEPLFRGFLWGSFRQMGIQNWLVCVIQAALFWLAHIYYYNTGINFWVVIPIGSLILGLVILKTKSTSYSMATHALINSLGDVFQHFVRLF